MPGLYRTRRLQATLAADSGSAGTPPADGSPSIGEGVADAPASLEVPLVVGATDEYANLQRRLLLATLVLTLVVTAITWPWFGATAARSLLLGGCCGLLYLRLLARSVGRIGPDSRSLGRFQIVVPALLIVAAARIPSLELLPAFLGFLLYKPALLLQALLTP